MNSPRALPREFKVSLGDHLMNERNVTSLVGLAYAQTLRVSTVKDQEYILGT